jgi:predicted nucleotidyltransferase
MNLTASQISQIKTLLSKQSTVCAAFLHGSAAKNKMRADSDVDIALLLNPHEKMPAAERLSLAGKIESIASHPVDIGLLSSNNLIYAKEVIQHGQILFTHNPFLSERFMSTCLSLYADLQEERKEVLHAYST